MINRENFVNGFKAFDKSVVLEIIDLFIEEYPDRIAKLTASIKEKDYAALKFAAHSLKGVVSNFFDPQVVDQARELENLAASKVNNTQDVTDEMLDAKINHTFNILKESLLTFVEELKQLKVEYPD
jgi:HPt (histidine-containing phosphotransfer) domain-containing protein